MQPPTVQAADQPTLPPDHKELPNENGATVVRFQEEHPPLPPDHKQLPDQDGAIVQNYQELPQANLLTECLRPQLHVLYPDGQFSIGCDNGIYWRWTQPVLDGCKAPDWFLVVGAPPMLDGKVRRSYVLWRECVRPLIVIEFVSGDGKEERDTTPFKGKFWVYEQAISAWYYAIYEVAKASVEVFRLEMGRYVPVSKNARGRYLIEPLRIELGILEGTYREMHLPWLRAWDSSNGELLPLAEERADLAEGLLVEMRQMLGEQTERTQAERKRAEELARTAENERKRTEEQARRVERLATRLRELGVAPEDV